MNEPVLHCTASLLSIIILETSSQPLMQFEDGFLELRVTWIIVFNKYYKVGCCNV